MGLFSCDCLNVRIHTKSPSVCGLDLMALNLLPEEASDSFFKQGVGVVVLDLAGITKEHATLCTSREVGEWSICSCMSCGTRTHAIRGQDEVIVSMTLQDHSGTLTSLTENPRYSPVFRILLPEVHDNYTSGTCGPEFFARNAAVEAAVRVVQQKVSTYLQQQQQVMEEKIRLFTLQQQSQFAALQQRVQNDKQAMLGLLVKLQEHDLRQSLSEAMVDSPPLSPPLSPAHDSENSPAQLVPEAAEALDTVPHSTVNVKRSNASLKSHPHGFSNPLSGRNIGHFRKKRIPQPDRLARSVDANTIFAMEGLDEEKEDSTPFFTSDDDGDTDDSSIVDDGTMQVGAINNRQYAMSLPISVPVWTTVNHSSNSDVDEKVPHLGDPDQIAASIQALAQSVRDGTEMFGDLPRPRLNTGDIVKSRPL